MFIGQGLDAKPVAIDLQCARLRNDGGLRLDEQVGAAPGAEAASTTLADRLAGLGEASVPAPAQPPTCARNTRRFTCLSSGCAR